MVSADILNEESSKIKRHIVIERHIKDPVTFGIVIKFIYFITIWWENINTKTWIVKTAHKNRQYVVGGRKKKGMSATTITTKIMIIMAAVAIAIVTLVSNNNSNSNNSNNSNSGNNGNKNTKNACSDEKSDKKVYLEIQDVKATRVLRSSMPLC